MGKLFFYVFMACLLIAVIGFFVLAVWDVPVQQTHIEKDVNTSHLLEKGN